MVLHGPIGICNYCRQQIHVGPLAYAAGAVDSFVLAYYFLECTFDALGWAH